MTIKVYCDASHNSQLGFSVGVYYIPMQNVQEILVMIPDEYLEKIRLMWPMYSYKSLGPINSRKHGSSNAEKIIFRRLTNDLEISEEGYEIYTDHNNHNNSRVDFSIVRIKGHNPKSSPDYISDFGFVDKLSRKILRDISRVLDNK